MTATLGNMVPPPGPGGSSAVDKLTAVLEALVNKLTAPASTGGSSGGGGTGTMSAAALSKKILKEQGDRYKLEEQIHKQTYDVLARLSSYRIRLEKEHTRSAERLNAQRSKALNAEAAKAEREAERTAKQQVRTTERTANKLTNLINGIEDRLANGGTLTERDRRRMSRAGVYSGITASMEKTSQANQAAASGAKSASAAETLAAQNARFDREGMQAAHNAMAVYRTTIEKRRNATLTRELKQEEKAADLEAEFNYHLAENVKFTRAFRKKYAAAHPELAGYMKTHNEHIDRTRQANVDASKADKDARKEAKAKETAANASIKRQEDFEIQQHNKQVDLDRKAKAKAERDAAQPQKQGGSFFGGFGRNMAIGRLYAVVNTVIAPLEAFGSGVGQRWIVAWKELTNVAFNAGKNLAYTTGMAESAAQTENTLKKINARLERQNAGAEINTAVGAKGAAGMTGASANIAKGVSDAVGHALQSPLTGFTDIVNQIGNAVGMADPGTMTRYNMVLRDLTATIGQGLSPVVQVITRVMKDFGDYLQPVVHDMIPKIRSVMEGLYNAIKPLIPLFVKELTDTIEELVQLISKVGGKLGLREMIMRGVGVPQPMIDAGPGGNPANEVNKARLAMVGGGMLGGAGQGAMLGGLIGGPMGALGGGLIGAGVGGLGALMNAPAQLDNGAGAGGGGGIAGILQQVQNMRKGNIAGAAVAQNATIGSGSDIGRRASQEAFLASSAKANIDPAQQLFQNAAQAALNFFLGVGKPAPVANGNAQAGVAPGDGGKGALEFGAGQGAFNKNMRAMMWGMLNPIKAWG